MAAYTTIDNPELHFQVKTWTGTGSSNALTLDGDEDMQPDYVMIKQKSGTQQWNGYDDLRGVQEYLGWNTSIVENTQSQGLTAFGSDGFTVGTDDMVNKSSSTYVAYCWKESATAGFDMVLYTGTGSAHTISHSLSAVPDVMITKGRSFSDGWIPYFKTSGNPIILALDDTVADRYSARWGPFFNSTAPTSSVFTVGTDSAINTSSGTHIAYLWSAKQGFSKFGTYVGNANADGPFVYTGFKPAWFMFKDTESTTSWIIKDNKRLGYNSIVPHLQANTNDAENTDGWSAIDFLSNGIKLRNADNSMNKSGSKFIFMAFSEAPFTNSSGVACNAG